MKGIVLAGGAGTRLYPYPDDGSYRSVVYRISSIHPATYLLGKDPKREAGSTHVLLLVQTGRKTRHHPSLKTHG